MLRDDIYHNGTHATSMWNGTGFNWSQTFTVHLFHSRSKEYNYYNGKQGSSKERGNMYVAIQRAIGNDGMVDLNKQIGLYDMYRLYDKNWRTTMYQTKPPQCSSADMCPGCVEAGGWKCLNVRLVQVDKGSGKMKWAEAEPGDKRVRERCDRPQERERCPCACNKGIVRWPIPE
jgi:hypothetical protein